MARTSNQHEAEDLAQDIVLEIMKSSRNIREERAFYGFMWSVAGNVYKQWCKKRLRKNECELTEDLHDENSDIYKSLDEKSDIFLLRRELAFLSEKYRKATILYYLENKSCAQISEILSVSESMVKCLLFKSVAEMIRKGYAVVHEGKITATMPVYTREQLELVKNIQKPVVAEVVEILKELNKRVTDILFTFVQNCQVYTSNFVK